MLHPSVHWSPTQRPCAYKMCMSSWLVRLRDQHALEADRSHRHTSLAQLRRSDSHQVSALAGAPEYLNSHSLGPNAARNYSHRIAPDPSRRLPNVSIHQRRPTTAPACRLVQRMLGITSCGSASERSRQCGLFLLDLSAY